MCVCMRVHRDGTSHREPEYYPLSILAGSCYSSRRGKRVRELLLATPHPSFRAPFRFFDTYLSFVVRLLYLSRRAVIVYPSSPARISRLAAAPPPARDVEFRGETPHVRPSLCGAAIFAFSTLARVRTRGRVLCAFSLCEAQKLQSITKRRVEDKGNFDTLENYHRHAFSYSLARKLCEARTERQRQHENAKRAFVK